MSSNAETEKLMASFRAFLKLHHKRVTSERIFILQQIIQGEAHFTARSLNEALENNKHHVSLTTIFSTLELLTEAKIIHRISIDTDNDYYEIATGEPVMYLVCNSCGKIKELQPDVRVTQVIEHADMRGFMPDNYMIQIKGLCTRCYKKKHRKSTKLRATSSYNSKMK